MKMKKLLILSTCSVLFLTGCGVAKLKDGSELVASLTGNKITTEELYNLLKEKSGKTALIEIIDETIFEKMYVNDAGIKKQVDDQISNLKAQYAEDWDAVIRDNGFKDEQAVRDFFELDFKKTKAIKEKLISDLAASEINDYYEDEVVGDIKASHILIKPDTTDNMSDEEIKAAEDEALTLAKSIIKQLDKGTDFAELAKKYSEDAANKDSGGDLGYFNKGDMVAEFEKAAYALAKGKYTTEPVKTTFGYHIILKTAVKAKAKLEEVEDDIKDAIVTKRLESDPTLANKTLMSIRNENKLTIYDSELKKAYDSYMEELNNN